MSDGPAAGWYPEGDTGMFRYWDGAAWTEHRRAPEPPPLASSVPPPPPPVPVAAASVVSGTEIIQPPAGFGLVPGTNQVTPLKPDPGGMHFLRYFGISLVMALSCYLIIGLVWMMIALAQTGRRKRDILMILIPIWGSVVATQTQWRYTAKNVYWSARSDRPSKSLFT